MEVFISIEGVIINKHYDNVANLEAFERELDESYGEGCWAYDRRDLEYLTTDDEEADPSLSGGDII